MRTSIAVREGPAGVRRRAILRRVARWVPVFALTGCQAQAPLPPLAEVTQAMPVAVPQSVPQPVGDACRDIDPDEPMSAVRHCRFPGTDMQRAYRLMLREHPSEAVHLHSTLPAADTAYDSTANDESVAVSHASPSPERHTIMLEYPGGTTTIVLRQDGDAIEVTTTRSAD